MEDETRHIDWVIFLCVVGLMLFSIGFVYSASAYIAEARFDSPEKFFWNHTIRVLIAIVALIVFIKIDYHYYQKISVYILLLSIIFLILVYFSEPINYAHRWINYSFINFQPSEIAKFALVIHISSLIVRRKEVLKTFKYGTLPVLVWSGIISILIAFQPNFSTAMLIFLITLTLLFIGNGNVFHILITLFCACILAILFIFLAPYRLKRIEEFLGSYQDGNLTMYSEQVREALIALGNGGLFGVGAGRSKQSHLFLPESYGDFIYSIIGEEYGFIGTVLILLVFALIFYRTIKIIKYAPDDFGKLLSAGIMITMAFYVIISAGVNTGLLPTTGIPMPFISYGGTASVFYAMAIGILLNISKQIKLPEYK